MLLRYRVTYIELRKTYVSTAFNPRDTMWMQNALLICLDINDWSSFMTFVLAWYAYFSAYNKNPDRFEEAVYTLIIKIVRIPNMRLTVYK